MHNNVVREVLQGPGHSIKLGWKYPDRLKEKKKYLCNIFGSDVEFSFHLSAQLQMPRQADFASEVRVHPQAKLGYLP